MINRINRQTFRQSNNAAASKSDYFLYFDDKEGRWCIGPSIGGDSIAVAFLTREICADAIDPAIHAEVHDSQWQIINSSNLQIKCLDEISCSCQNFDASGFGRIQSQLIRGHFMITNLTIDGRKCFNES